MDITNIHIDIFEAYRYMGGVGAPDESMENALNNAAVLVLEHTQPRFVQKICDLEKVDGIRLKDTALELSGKAVAALLSECELCSIFCATIGNDIETQIRKWQTKDIAFAAMLDACASCAVESLCDGIEAALREEYGAKGCFLTDRFSPGYGDLPLSIQGDFCSTLDSTRKIGVSVSDSSLMTPRKTVTALIGISDKAQKHRRTGCASCLKINDCNFRETGVSCYGQSI